MTGSAVEKERAFEEAFRYMRNRIRAFVALPMGKLDKISLRSSLEEIGRMEGSTQLV